MENKQVLKYLQPFYWYYMYGLGVKVMVFNATFNNFSLISWRLVLLLEEAGVLRGYQRPAASH